MSFLARWFGRPARPRGRHAGARGVPPGRPLPSTQAQPPGRVTATPAGPTGPGGSVVALIYRDGTSVAYAAGDPRSRAYRTLADHLAARG